MTELLQRLSEAAPELCGVLNTDSGTPAYRIICEDYHFCLYPTCTELLPWQKNDRTCAIARIRDWIVGQGWTVRCASGTYDGAILYMWEAGPTFHIEPLVECDNTDELLVAIDCALAVAKESEKQ